ncbi:DAK2 domain-containing protein [Paracoccus caeni]|uniref:DAK2 domain-containing protein n=1 Tax=Paracoccus caeni TaxID=657651 RepID=A0A934SHU5_9RHOB|nr:DAK2 domain-containing protein [Paracoccus caeni]MBK4217928.1 DAK2 domain-containing protein [Paracoccus caeni]
MITPQTLQDATARAHDAMAVLEQELNQADAVLGDGDTGGMLARVIGGMAALDLSQEDDLGAAFAALARAALANTGSSLGTLMATALTSMAKATKGTPSAEWSDLSPMLADARDAMLKRGGASLGDKTVLDGLDAVATALNGVETPAAAGAQARAAADQALATFRDLPCKVGRARMFADKSIGIDDPGMLAFAKLVAALAA